MIKFLHIMAIHISYSMFFVTFCVAVLYLAEDYSLKRKLSGAMFDWLPNLSVLDKLNYRSIGLGFPILTIAIVSGFFLKKDVMGTYWNWNIREVYSLVSWILYAVILHVRLSSKLRGKKVALLSVFAFSMVIFSLFAGCGEMR